MILVFLGVRLGFSVVKNGIRQAVLPGTQYARHVLFLPDEIRDELTTLDAVVENAGNPTNAREHETLLTQRDEQLGYVLRPGSRISAYMLRAQNPLNIDPPVMHMRSDAELSHALRTYLAQQTRLHYSYSISEKGFRRTVPAVESERKILMVGDSVLFGVGVNDDDTLASSFQKLAGDSHQVVNAGVGGYSGLQALQVANKLLAEDTYVALIYATSQNDFTLSGGSYAASAREVLKEFATVKQKFSRPVIVLVVGHMEYMLHDILGEAGWRQSRIDRSQQLFDELPTIVRDLGMAYVDSRAIFEEQTKRTKTILGRAALYADHAHLSALGNRLAAEKIYDALREHAIYTSGTLHHASPTSGTPNRTAGHHLSPRRSH
jgi:lysophospholipase L1-like esterase